MDTTRAKVRARRRAVLLGIPSGILMSAMMFSIVRQESDEPYRSVFFGEVDHWPTFVQSFLPLDVVAVGAFFTLLIYTVQLGTDPAVTNKPFNFRNAVMFALGVFVACGSFFAMLGVAFRGWYGGLEFFLVGGTFFSLALAAIGIAGGIVIFASLMIGKLIEAWWKRFRTHPAAQPLIKFGQYYEAKDIPEESSST